MKYNTLDEQNEAFVDDWKLDEPILTSIGKALALLAIFGMAVLILI